MKNKGHKREETGIKLFRLWVFALIISIATIAVYLPGLGNGFVNWDDDVYVYNNPNIRSLDKDFFTWAFGLHAANWHPLTWVSHAVDYAVWGLNPAGHHFSNILLHGLNTALVFILTILLVIAPGKKGSRAFDYRDAFFSKAVFTACITALLFGLHPLQVESVIWVAERKNLLSGFFMLLCSILYVYYALRDDDKIRVYFYAASLCMFILALMSKPIAVIIPFTMVILDIYPLKRFSVMDNRHEWKALIREKIPFFLLSFAATVITVIAQHKGGAVKSFGEFPFIERILNAFRGLFFYIEKIFWPVGLSPVYPYPKDISLLTITYIIPVLSVILISVFCVLAWKRGRKIFPAVWAYYIISLLPVIGVVQIGSQAYADRYAYFSGVGIFILTALGITAIIERFTGGITLRSAREKPVILLPVVLALCVLGFLTVKQTHIWKNSLTLWTRVTEKFPAHADAYINRANAYVAEGKYEDALRDLDRAVSLKKDYTGAYNNRGLVHTEAGNYKAAFEDFSKAIEINPEFAEAYANRAGMFVKKGDFTGSFSDINKALQLQPENSGFYNSRCEIYNMTSGYDNAVRDCSHALELDPYNVQALKNRGLAYFGLKNYSEAISDFNSYLKISPGDAGIHFSRGAAYMEKGETENAFNDFQKATQMNPDAVEAYMRLGVIYGEKGKIEQAAEAFSKAIRLKPDYAAAYYNRGAAYYRLGREKEAMDDVRKAARLGDKEVQNILKARGITW